MDSDLAGLKHHEFRFIYSTARVPPGDVLERLNIFHRSRSPLRNCWVTQFVVDRITNHDQLECLNNMLKDLKLRFTGRSILPSMSHLRLRSQILYHPDFI